MIEKREHRSDGLSSHPVKIDSTQHAAHFSWHDTQRLHAHYSPFCPLMPRETLTHPTSKDVFALDGKRTW